MDSFLIKQESYLEAGVHIGTKIKVVDMNQFIYRMRNDGLYVLDLRKIDERVRLAGKLLSQYEPEEILVVASRTYSSNAATVFSNLTGIKVLTGRFIPGILTNVHRDDFVEPKMILVCDPKGERQAVVEAGRMGIPTVGLCDTDNNTMFIDFAVPCNNKGRRSLALIFYLLTREYLMGRNKIASYDEFKSTVSEFEAEMPTDSDGLDASSKTTQDGSREDDSGEPGANEEKPASQESKEEKENPDSEKKSEKGEDASSDSDEGGDESKEGQAPGGESDNETEKKKNAAKKVSKKKAPSAEDKAVKVENEKKEEDKSEDGD